MEGSKEPGAWLEASRHSEAHRVARAAIGAAQQRMISLLQTRRSDIPKYHINEWVLIAAEEIPDPRLSKKMSDKWVGPFKIKEVLGKESKLQANNIRVDPSWSKMEPIINVDCCKPYVDPNSFKGRPSMKRNEQAEGDLPDKYKVEEVLKERTVDKRKESFVLFKGWGKQDQQWVAADQFDEDDGIVLAFRAKTKAAAEERKAAVTRRKVDKEAQKEAAKVAKAAGKKEKRRRRGGHRGGDGAVGRRRQEGGRGTFGYSGGRGGPAGTGLVTP